MNNNKPKVFSLIDGPRMAYQVPKTLVKNAMLYKHLTDFILKKSIFSKLLVRLPLFSKLSKRKQFCDDNLISDLGFYGFKDLTLRRFQKQNVHKRWIDSSFKLNFLAIKEIMSGKNGFDIFYGINRNSLNAAIHCKSYGKKIVIEQISAPCIVEYTICKAVYESSDLKEKYDINVDKDSVNYYSKIEELEWLLADIILCPSKFVYDCLISLGVSSTKLRVLPYFNLFPILDVIPSKNFNNFNVITTGGFRLQKGAKELIELSKLFDNEVNVSIFHAGHNYFDSNVLKLTNHKISFLGQLSRVELMNILDTSHLYIHMSHCEGSSLSIYEALSRGLPVICTSNSGSVITHGFDGFIIDVGDFHTAYKYINLLCTDRDLYTSLSKNAILTAKKFDVDTYSNKLVQILCEM